MELVSYHRLLETNKSLGHEQQIVGDCHRKRQCKTGKGRVHERENCDECNPPNDKAGENIETGGHPSVHCAAVHHYSSC
jgi:hypothetical protein